MGKTIPIKFSFIFNETEHEKPGRRQEWRDWVGEISSAGDIYLSIGTQQREKEREEQGYYIIFPE